jgi:hypothetical protein
LCAVPVELAALSLRRPRGPYDDHGRVTSRGLAAVRRFARAAVAR